jgi:hypothetical protein
VNPDLARIVLDSIKVVFEGQVQQVVPTFRQLINWFLA